MRFLNQVAVVTGASYGIGLEVVRLIAEEGGRVILNARGVDRLQAATNALRDAGHEVMAVAGDIALATTIREIKQSALATFGRLDILVNNAGGSQHSSPFLEVSRPAWQRTLASNLQSAFFLLSGSGAHHGTTRRWEHHQCGLFCRSTA